MAAIIDSTMTAAVRGALLDFFIRHDCISHFGEVCNFYLD